MVDDTVTTGVVAWNARNATPAAMNIPVVPACCAVQFMPTISTIRATIGNAAHSQFMKLTSIAIACASPEVVKDHETRTIAFNTSISTRARH